jgi:hypothetical protein
VLVRPFLGVPKKSRVERELEKHEQSFEPVVARVLGTRPTSGLLAMQSYDESRRELVCFLASEMIRNGVVPTEHALKQRFSRGPNLYEKVIRATLRTDIVAWVRPFCRHPLDAEWLKAIS